MLVQCMLTAWATTQYQGYSDGLHPKDPKGVDLGVLPPSGSLNNRLPAWIHSILAPANARPAACQKRVRGSADPAA